MPYLFQAWVEGVHPHIEHELKYKLSAFYVANKALKKGLMVRIVPVQPQTVKGNK